MKNYQDNGIVYDKWKTSVVECINRNVDLYDFERDNLIEIVNDLSSMEFDRLSKNESFEDGNEKFYFLQFSDGEVVEAKLYFIFREETGYVSKSIDLYQKENPVQKSSLPKETMIEVVDLKVYRSSELTDELFIISKVSDNRIKSKMGNKMRS